MGNLPRNAWIAAGLVVGLFILVRILRGLFRNTSSSPLFQLAACPDCGWRGQVSRYAGRCPQCNRPLGEQKSQHRT